jgi:hypothetical protein
MEDSSSFTELDATGHDGCVASKRGFTLAVLALKSAPRDTIIQKKSHPRPSVSLFIIFIFLLSIIWGPLWVRTSVSVGSTFGHMPLYRCQLMLAILNQYYDLMYLFRIYLYYWYLIYFSSSLINYYYSSFFSVYSPFFTFSVALCCEAQSC